MIKKKWEDDLSSAKQEGRERERERGGGGGGERQVREKMKDRSMNAFFMFCFQR